MTNWLGQIPLKDGEKHCPSCLDYGVLPILYNQHETLFKLPTCLNCMGVAKILPKNQKKT
jgi:hypothetical protein